MNTSYEILLRHGVQPSLLTDGDLESFESFCRQAKDGTADFASFARKCEGYIKDSCGAVTDARKKASATLKTAIDLLDGLATPVSGSLFSAFSGDKQNVKERHCRAVTALEPILDELGGLSVLCILRNNENGLLSSELLLRKIALSEYSRDAELRECYRALSSEFADFEVRLSARQTETAELIQKAVSKISEFAAESEAAALSNGNSRLMFDTAVRKYLLALHDILLLFQENQN